MRFVLRLIGYAFLAGAFAAFVVDGTRSVAARSIMVFPLAETMRWLMPDATAELAAWFADAPITVGRTAGDILQAPTWLASGGLAALCFLAGRKRPVRPRS